MIPWEDRHRWLGKVVFRRVSGSGDGDGDGGVVVLNEQCKKERGLGQVKKSASVVAFAFLYLGTSSGIGACWFWV